MIAFLCKEPFRHFLSCRNFVSTFRAFDHTELLTAYQKSAYLRLSQILQFQGHGSTGRSLGAKFFQCSFCEKLPQLPIAQSVFGWRALTQRFLIDLAGESRNYNGVYDDITSV